MSHGKIIFGIGVVLVFISMLGFPSVWNKIFVTTLGLWLCGIVISVKYGGRPAHHAEDKQQPSVSDGVLSPGSHDHSSTI